jgi:hypothetical protein
MSFSPDNSPGCKKLGGTGFAACVKTPGFLGLFILSLIFQYVVG